MLLKTEDDVSKTIGGLPTATTTMYPRENTEEHHEVDDVPSVLPMVAPSCFC